MVNAETTTKKATKGPLERLPPLAKAALRLIGVFTVLWLLFISLRLVFALGTNWPLWIWAALGALAIELILWLSRFERGGVDPKLARRLLSLRLAALAVLLLIFLEPLWAITGERRVDKTIAVLIDDSESMHLEDEGWSDSGTLDLVELFDAKAVSSRPGYARQLRRIERILAGLEATNPADDPGEVQHLIRQLKAASLLPNTRAEVFDQAAEQPAAFAALLADVRAAAAGLPRQMESADEAWLARQSLGRRERIKNAAKVTRAQTARQVLVRGERPLLDQLSETYDLEVFAIATRPQPATAEQVRSPKPFAPDGELDRGGTDLAGGLRHVLRTVPPEQLGGVLVLSDGRHNMPGELDLPASQLAGRGLPVHSVLLGTRLGLKDATVARVEAPETVFVEEDVVIQAELSFSGLRGKSATVQLLHNDELAEQRVLPISDERERQSVTFEHEPETEGVVEYTIRILELPDERFANNNERTFEVAVSDDRTNVLLIDGTPRWEFRYLRNLFYGRDAGVHLQYVLLEPDHIIGQGPTRPVPASADRAFGEAEATALPATETDWLKFDVIILGDVAARALPKRVMDIIVKAVTKRGAVLVVSAGQNHMPHAHTSEAFRDILPVHVTDGLNSKAPEPAFRIGVTGLGRLHPIMQQAPEPNASEDIWLKQPPFFWRHPALRAREGAEVLAFAERVDPLTGILAEVPIRGNTMAAKKARSARERTRPLVVVRRAGRGHCICLTTDQTWRLRYKSGDVYHHKFWGQLLQWGAGERLRSGNDQVRIGTDKLVYGPDDPVNVQAKIIDESLMPSEDEPLEISLVPEGEQEPIGVHPLTFRENSAGTFEATLPAISEDGRYRLVLPTKQSAAAVETSITVAGGEMSVELAELSADPTTLQRLADLTGGEVFGPVDELEAVEMFGESREIIPERRDITLWDSWPFYLAFFAFVAFEWISRRKANLP